MAKKIKVSRKKIKQPDDFLTFTDRAFKYFSENKAVTFCVIGGAILAMALAVGISYTVTTRRDKADRLMLDAFSILNTPLAGKLTQQSILGGAKNYSTDKERAQEAITKLNEVIKQFGSGSVGLEARFHLGEVYLSEGNYPLAISSYQDFLKRLGTVESAGNKIMREPALLGLGKAYYSSGDLKNGELYLQKVIDSKSDAYLAEANLGMARVLIQKGEPGLGREKLDWISKTYPGSIYDQLAEIEKNNLAGAKPSK